MKSTPMAISAVKVDQRASSARNVMGAKSYRLMRGLFDSATIKMVGFLKNLWRKTRQTTTDSTSAPAIGPTAEAVPASSPNSYSPFRPATAHKNPGQHHNGNGKGVEVSLQKILAGLPLELQHRIRNANVGEQTIAVRLEKILPQLSRGTVKVSFGELRQAAPGVFTAESDQDWVLVALPLADILSQLNPALITRRRVQHQVEVPADISSPFDPSRLGLLAGGNGGQTQPVASAIPSRQVSPAPFKSVATARGGLGSVPPGSQPAMPPASAARQSPPSVPKVSPDVAARGASPNPVAKAPPASTRIAPGPTVPPPPPAAITPTARTLSSSTPPPLAPLRLTPSAPPPTPTPVPAAKAAPTPSASSVAPTSLAASHAPIRVARETNGDRVHESEVKRPNNGAKFATPHEVVSRAAALDGVAGALIALPDGLMVAHRLPPDLNAGTLAAFLPQIFGRVSQCTKELRMGGLNSLTFTVGNVPWEISRTNAIFFAAFGREGQPLPTAQLAALTAELNHKPK